MFEFYLSLWILDACGFVDLGIGLFSVGDCFSSWFWWLCVLRACGVVTFDFDFGWVMPWLCCLVVLSCSSFGGFGLA